MSLAHSSVLLSGAGDSPEFPVLVDGSNYPVDSGVTSDALVSRVNTDNLVVLVHGIGTNPVTGGGGLG